MSKITFSSEPISSRNAGEVFIRVDMVGVPDEFGFLNRKTGFLPVAEDKFDTALKAILEGKRVVKFGSQTKNGNYNLNLTSPDAVIEGSEATDPALVEHKA